MDRKSSWENDMAAARRYRERSNYFRQNRELIYVNGVRHVVNKYHSTTDSPGSPLRRNYILMNATPNGTLHVCHSASNSHYWSPRIINTSFTSPTLERNKRCQSSMDLRRSENYTSSEDLRYHTVRKADSCDNILNSKQYLPVSSPRPPSESGISVSDIDSIFIDDDLLSQSSIGSADRSFCISESDFEGTCDRLESINEDEGGNDSVNNNSSSHPNTTSSAMSNLSQGLVNPAVLTRELLKLKEQQEKRRQHAKKDMKAYIENNYPPQRNLSSTSNDSCFSEMLQTTNTDNHKSARRRLTYSTESGFGTGTSSHGQLEESELVVKSIETCSENNSDVCSPSQSGSKFPNSSNMLQEEVARETIYKINNNNECQLFSECLYENKPYTDTSTFDHLNKNSQLNVKETSEKTYFQETESTCSKTSSYCDQRVQLSDESSIKGLQSLLPINEQTKVKQALTQMSEQNLFTTNSQLVNVFESSETLNSVNLNRAEQISFRQKTNQSLITTQVRDYLADDKNCHTGNSRHYTCIDEKVAEDNVETTVVIADGKELKSTDVICQQVVDNDYNNCSLKNENQAYSINEICDNLTAQCNVSEYKTSDSIKRLHDKNDVRYEKTHLLYSGHFDHRQSNLNQAGSAHPENKEYFSDQSKLFTGCDKDIEIVRGDIGVVCMELKESYITELSNKVGSDISDNDKQEDVFLDSDLNKNRDRLIENNTQSVERFIDREERIISQSLHRLIIPKSTTTHQLNEDVNLLSASNSKDSRMDKTITREADYCQQHRKADYDQQQRKGYENYSDIYNSQGNSSSEQKSNMYEVEVYDNPEDFKPVHHTGVKISVIRNPNPVLTRYKMQTIKEQEEADFSKTENKFHQDIVQKNDATSKQLPEYKRNISHFHVTQSVSDQRSFISNVKDINRYETEDRTTRVNESHSTFISQTTSSTLHEIQSQSSTYNREIFFPDPNYNFSIIDESVHEKNLMLGEQGSENMGKSFQFVRDRTPSPEDLESVSKLINDKVTIDFKNSSEVIDINDVSFISDTSSMYQSSCSAEITDVEEPGSDTFYTQYAESDILNISYDSNSSYSTICTAEVNIDIPGIDDANSSVTSINTSIVSPLSESSDTESGYYTLTRSGKTELTRQDTSEDMTSFMNEESTNTVNKTQSIHSLSEQSSVQLERALSTEDITSFVDSASSYNKSHREVNLTEAITVGPEQHLVSSQEDITSYNTNQNLQDLVEFSEKLAQQFEDLANEDQHQSEICVGSDICEVVTDSEGCETSENLDLESTGFNQSKIMKTEYFDSTENLTGCIEYEVESDDLTDLLGQNNVDPEDFCTLIKTSSTENLLRNTKADEVVTYRKQSVDHMRNDEGSGVRRINSSEDITSFEQDIKETEITGTNVVNRVIVGSNIRIPSVNTEETVKQDGEVGVDVREEENVQTHSQQFTRHSEVIRPAVAAGQQESEQISYDGTDSAESVLTTTNSVESCRVQSFSQTLEENLTDLITSESGIDHTEQFESLIDKDKSKIQMFIIYQDFTQMRERSRLKKELSLLTEQYEHMDKSILINRTEQLSKINSFLDSLLLNLKVTENVQTYKNKLEKVKHVENVYYYRDNTEIYKQMQKFSDIIRELELCDDYFKLNVKLSYCLEFLKTKTLDAQFDSLCDFVCLESQREDIELLQNHLCLVTDGHFRSRRLLKYLQRGFSQDMKTIWKPKVRNKLKSVIENTELTFCEKDLEESCVERDAPCCEFHVSDKESRAVLGLWSDSDSVTEQELTSQKVSRSGIIN